MKEKLRNPFVQQYALEILLPIVGYFFFDWTLTIIAVFYFIDQIASELVYFRRIFWISKHNSLMSPIKAVLIAIASFITLFTTSLFVFMLYWPALINQTIEMLLDEIITFGISEGWFLLPLVVAVYYMKDLFTFYMPRRYTQHNLNKAIFARTVLNIGILILILIGLTISSKIIGNEIIALLIFLILKISYDFTIGKWTSVLSIEK